MKKFYLFVFVLLTFSDIFLILVSNREKERVNQFKFLYNLKRSQEENSKQKISDYQKILLYTTVINNSIVRKNERLKFEDSEMLFSNIFSKNKNLLVIRVPKYFCSDCVKNIFDLLANNPQVNNKFKIVFIASPSNYNLIFPLLEKTNYNIFISKNTFIINEKEEYPYIVTFKLGNKYQCKNAFIIFKDTDKLIKDYIKLLLQTN